MSRKVHEISFAIGAKMASNFKSTFNFASAQMKGIKGDIRDLNNQYIKGAISVQKYQEEHRRLTNQLERAQRAQTKLNQSMKNQYRTGTGGVFGGGSALGSLSRVSLAGMGAVTALGPAFYLGASLKKAIDYESQLSSIQALTGLTNEQMNAMNKLALKLGADTKYSALEAAQGIEELLKSGLTPATVQTGALEAALNLATAGGLDLAAAAEIMADALNGFRKDGMSAADAANILAGAANASSTNVQQIKYGLAAVGPVAEGIGITFKEVNAVLAAFSNNMLKGSDAGTSLKTFLANVQPGTKKATQLFEKYGLINKKTGENILFSNGQLKDLAEVSGILQKNFKKLTDQQRSSAFFEMFGSDAVRAANILFKEGAEGIRNVYQEMSKVTALDVAKQKMDNAAGAVEQFKGALETMQISALTPTLPLVKDLALMMADMAEKHTPALTAKLENLSDALRYLFDPYPQETKDPFAIKSDSTSTFENYLNGRQAVLEHFQDKIPGFGDRLSILIHQAMDRLAQSYKDWLNSGGQEKIDAAISDVLRFVTESVEKNLPAFTELGGSIAASIAMGMGNGLWDLIPNWAKPSYTGWREESPKKYARGGFVNSPHLGMVGEAGPEAIIPMDGSARAKALWQRAGQRLGMGAGSGDSSITIHAPITVNFQGNADANSANQSVDTIEKRFNSLIRDYQNQQKRTSFGAF